MNARYLSLATAILSTAVVAAGAARAQTAAGGKPSGYRTGAAQAAGQAGTGQAGTGQVVAPGAGATQSDPYQGVSQPPATDVITTSEEEAPATPAPKPASRPETRPEVKFETRPELRPDVAASTAGPASAAERTRAASNPDAGIIETPLPPETPQPAGATAGSTPTLRTRPVYNPDAEVVTEVPGPANALPEGTLLRARLLQQVSAEDTSPGTPFRAQLTQDLVRNGRVVIPVGSELRGKVMYLTSGRRISGRSVIKLRPDEVVLPDGTRYPLHAEVVDTQGSDTTTNSEGEVVSKEHGKRTLAEFALGSGGGAIVGGVVAGPAGAIAGSAIGAGVITTHWLRQEHAAILPANSTVVFSLNDALPVTPERN